MKACRLALLFVLALPAWDAQTKSFGSVFQAVTVVSECGGLWISPEGNCTFSCFAGDNLRARCHASSDLQTPYVQVTATCGGVTLQCQDGSGYPYDEFISPDVVLFDDPNGSCQALGYDYGGFWCADIIINNTGDGQR